MMVKKTRINFYIKLNFLGSIKNTTAFISLLIAFFVFFTVVDLVEYTDAFKNLQLDNDLSNRVVSIDLNQNALAKKSVFEQRNLLDQIIQSPVVENYSFVDFSESVSYLNIKLISYTNIESFILHIKDLDASIDSIHHYSDKYQKIVQFNLFLTIIYLLALTLSIGMLTFFIYKSYTSILLAIKVFYYIGANLIDCFIFVFSNIFTILLLSGISAILIERIFIRYIGLNVISKKFDFAMSAYDGRLYYTGLFIYLVVITLVFFIKGVKNDFEIK